MDAPQDLPEFTRRYLPKDWMADMGQVLVELESASAISLQGWIKERIWTKYSHAGNLRDRTQLFFEAAAYIDQNRAELIAGNVLALGKDGILVSMELVSVMYMILLKMDRNLSDFEPSMMIGFAEKCRARWKEDGNGPSQGGPWWN